MISFLHAHAGLFQILLLSQIEKIQPFENQDTGYSEDLSAFSVCQKKGSPPHGVLDSRIPLEQLVLTFGVTDPFEKLVKTKDHFYRKTYITQTVAY